MARPLLYDFKRTLTSKSVLITIGVLILISFAVLPSIFGVGSGGFGNTPTPMVVGYYDNGAYHFITYASNQFGQGVSGYVATVNMTSPSGQQSTGSGTTDSTGYAIFSINAPQNENNTVGLTIAFPGGSGTINMGSNYLFRQFSGNGSISPVPAGVVVSVFGGNAFSTVTDSNNASVSDVRVFYVAPHGQVPTGYSVYFKLINSTTGLGGGPIGNQQYNQSEMQLLGTLAGYSTTFPPPAVPSGYAKGSYFVFELFYPNATLAQLQLYNVDQFYAPPAPPIQVTSLVSLFFTGIFAIFIPLIAIIGSYNSYGKDRVTGVLESVLSRPVTRRGLSISRYLSTFAGMAVAIIIAIAVVDGIVYYYGHAFVDSTILLASTGGFFVDLAAFVGIMMLLSHLLKSSGALIGIGIGLFVLMDFFWSLIPFGIAAATHTGFGTPAYNQITIALQFVNPAQFVSLVLTYLTGLSNGSLITPSQYGITIPSLVAAGLLWIAVPFAIYLYLAMKRD